MKMYIEFPEGQKVHATFDNFLVKTDQPVESGGSGSDPDPFSLFLSSIGTCTGIYVLRFCQERQLPTKDLSLVLTTTWNDKRHLVETITMTIHTGSSFPEKYKKALVRTAKLCTVKRHLENPPTIELKITDE